MRKISLHSAKSRIARLNTIRDINKQIVLNYVRDRSPISRAEIARQTELHRSTVSVIVEELLEEGLIVEIGAGISTGGRRPTLYQLRTGTATAIGIDLTPRTTTIAVADLAGNFLEKESFATSPDQDFMMRQIVERVVQLSEKYREDGLEIGVTVPGLVERDSGMVLHIPYYDWREWDIAGALHSATGLHVEVENDANATALAELWFGPERIGKSNTFLLVLVGEGVGTGIVFDGQIYRGEKGSGGEFGHMIAGPEAPVECSCGSKECWEAYASEKSLVERYCRLVNLEQSKRRTIEAGNVIELALNGEPSAIKALRETAYYLGNGLSNLIVGLSPQTVVVSGRITKAWQVFADELKRVTERSILAGLPRPVLMPSSLGDSPTLIGAYGLVLARKFGLAS
ncbi:MAG TPA: ROK family transcriptional regulator [Pyrinomonadaceae bacterium]|nr:ROK family transcriptional regulator [Pyrinomonadaceae bacterium]